MMRPPDSTVLYAKSGVRKILIDEIGKEPLCNANVSHRDFFFKSHASPFLLSIFNFFLKNFHIITIFFLKKITKKYKWGYDTGSFGNGNFRRRQRVVKMTKSDESGRQLRGAGELSRG